MALVIKDAADLKEYLEARRRMAERQQEATRGARNKGSIPQADAKEDLSHAKGMMYAYDEAIKAVEAMQNGPAITELSCRVLTRVAELPDHFLFDDAVCKSLKNDQRFAVIDSHSTCGPAGRQTFEGVALVFELELNNCPHPNPAVVFRQPTTIGLTEKIVQFLKTKPWLENFDG